MDAGEKESREGGSAMTKTKSAKLGYPSCSRCGTQLRYGFRMAGNQHGKRVVCQGRCRPFDLRGK